MFQEISHVTEILFQGNLFNRFKVRQKIWLALLAF